MPQRPRGTRDFAPDEAAVRHRLAETFRDVFARHGYKEVQTPTFEELELFTAKSGPGVISELYDFQDKGERHLTLRPELTAPVMRMVFQDHAFDPKPLKWFYFGNCFRYDRPQTGRYREFWQFGCEQVGAGTPVAYAELIALGDGLLSAAGLEGRDLAVGHVKLLGELVDKLGLDDESRATAMRAIDKRDDGALGDICRQAKADEEDLVTLLAALDSPDLETARGRIGDHPALDELDAVFRHLDDFGVTARLNLGIARGLDYYTGVVFEVHADALGAQSQLLGGGGYDLSGVFDANPIPTMGFGLGFDRTLVALEEEGKEMGGADGPHVYLGALGDEAQGVVIRTARDLRRLGVRTDMDLMGRKPNQIAKAADAAGARHLVILGDRDLDQGACAVKDLRSGDATDVDLEDLVDWVVEQVARKG